VTSKYVYLYSGGNPPKNEADGKAMMNAWMAYFGKLGKAVVDGGAPFARGESKLFGAAKHSHATGYSIIQADNLKQALALTEGHPHLANGGGIEVFECAKM
jgi:hypothetical protein